MRPGRTFVSRYESDALELEVLDDGPGAANGFAGGHGLIGMRERVAVVRRRVRCRPAAGRRLRRPRAAAVRRGLAVISVVVADDQALVRGGFRMILDAQADLEVVGEAEDGERAVAAVRELRPDVVLMDVRMPVLDGIEATRRIVAESSAVARARPDDVRPGRASSTRRCGREQAGSCSRACLPAKLADAVRTVAGGEALLAPSITRRLVEAFVRRPPPGQGHADFDELTERELEVLRLIARGLSNTEIAAELFVSEATVKTHVNRVFSKLDLRDRVQAVVRAYESGLVQPGAQ